MSRLFNQSFTHLFKLLPCVSPAVKIYEQLQILSEKWISESGLDNALHTMCELNVKDHKRGMNCVRFKVHIVLAAEDQVDITDKLCMGTGAWLCQLTLLKRMSLSVKAHYFLPGVKLSGPAVKALIGTFPSRQITGPYLPYLCVY